MWEWGNIEITKSLIRIKLSKQHMKVNSQILKLILVLSTVLSFQSAKAQFEPEEFSQIGYSNAINALPYTLPIVEDDKFAMMLSSGSWRSSFKHKSVKDRISLWIKDSTLFIPKFNYLFTFKVDTFDVLGNMGSFNVDMQISYDPNAHKAYIDKNVFEFEGVHKYTLSILNVFDSIVNQYVNSSNPDLWENVGIKGEILVERYYLHPYHIPALAINHAVTDNLLNLTWTVPTGSTPNTYELEWAYIDTFGIHPDSLTYDFSHNSTRVLTSDNQYSLHLIYDAGVLLYRVRRVRPDSVYFKYPKKSDWLPASNPIGYVKDFSSTNKVYFTTHENKTKNWNYSITFAEKGLKKEVVNYFDGSLKRRQGVTMNNTDNFTIVDESIYDHHGREAIKVLPTPTNTDSFNFYPKFSLNTSEEAYGPDDFDNSDNVGDICNTSANPMSTSRGASNYYSPENPNKNLLENQYIPDAAGYPFAQTEYMPDGSGRIRRQGGVGFTHQIGSGHETRYLYGKPDKDELIRLFGSEVGLEEHYKENAVIDPNGQASVSYIDQHGRVVATALAGVNPSQMSQVDQYKSAEFVLDTVANQNLIDFNKGELQLSYPVTVKTAGVTSFKYSMDAPSYYFGCAGIAPCYKCVYDLDFKIIDDCKSTLVHFTKKVGRLNDSGCFNAFRLDQNSSEFVTLGNGIAISADSIYGNLNIGSYKVIKTLTLNTDSLFSVFSERIAADTCFKSELDFVVDEIGKLDSIDCNDCDTCEVALSLCQLRRESMRLDFQPGNGQYADVNYIGNTPVNSDDPTSIFHLGSWQYNFQSLSDSTYKDEDGNGALVLVNGLYQQPQDLSVPEFIEHYDPSWADALIDAFHPEYCQLHYCETELNGSNAYDELMQETLTYDSAVARGLMDPFGDDGDIPTKYDPYFFDGSTPISDRWSIMYTRMNDYSEQYIAPANRVNFLDRDHDFDIYQMALAMSHCDYISDEKERAACYVSYVNEKVENKLGASEKSRNAYWQTFRGLYQGEKLKVRESFTDTFTYPKPCKTIGTGDYVNKFAHFSKTSQFITDNWTHNLTNANKLKSDMQDSIDDQPVCESQIPYWEDQLKNCPNWNQYRDSIIAGFLEVCDDSRKDVNAYSVGTGSTVSLSSNARFADFDAVLIHHLGANYKTMLCNTDLIQWPPANNPFKMEKIETLSDCKCLSVADDILDYKSIYSICPDTSGYLTQSGEKAMTFFKKMFSNGDFFFKTGEHQLMTLSNSYQTDIQNVLFPIIPNFTESEFYIEYFTPTYNNNTNVLVWAFFIKDAYGTDVTFQQNNGPKCNLMFTLPAGKQWSNVVSIEEGTFVDGKKLGLVVKFSDNTTGIATLKSPCFSGLVDKCEPKLLKEDYINFMSFYNEKNGLTLSEEEVGYLIENCGLGGGGGSSVCAADVDEKDIALMQVFNQYLRKASKGGFRTQEQLLTGDSSCWTGNVNRPDFLVKSPAYMANFFMDYHRFNDIWWEAPALDPNTNEYSNNDYNDPYFIGGIHIGQECDLNAGKVSNCYMTFGDPNGDVTSTFGGAENIDSFAQMRFDYDLGEYVMTAYKIDESMYPTIVIDTAVVSFNSCYTNCKPEPQGSYAYQFKINKDGEEITDVEVTYQKRAVNAFEHGLNYLAKNKKFFGNINTAKHTFPNGATTNPAKYYPSFAASNGSLTWFRYENEYPKYQFPNASTDSMLIAYIGDPSSTDPASSYQISFQQLDHQISFDQFDMMDSLQPDTQRIKEMVALGKPENASHYFIIKAGKIELNGDTTWVTLRGVSSYFQPFKLTSATIEEMQINIPEGIAPECNCLTCPEVKEGLDLFFNEYPTAKVNHPNYPLMVTSYLNKLFKTQLAFIDYQQYFDNCLMEYYRTLPKSLADIRITASPNMGCEMDIFSMLETVNDSIGNTAEFLSIAKNTTTQYIDIDLERVPLEHISYVKSSINNALQASNCNGATQVDNYIGQHFLTVAIAKDENGNSGCNGSFASFVTWAKLELGAAALNYSSSLNGHLLSKNGTDMDIEYYEIDTTGVSLKDRSLFISLLDSWANGCDYVYTNTNSYVRRNYKRYLGQKSFYTSLLTESDTCVFCEEVEEMLLDYQYEVGSKGNKAAIADFNASALRTYFGSKDIDLRVVSKNSGCATCGKTIYVNSKLKSSGTALEKVLNQLMKDQKLATQTAFALNTDYQTDLNEAFATSEFGAGASYQITNRNAQDAQWMQFYTGANNKWYQIRLGNIGDINLDTMRIVRAIIPELGNGEITDGALWLYGPSYDVYHKMSIETQEVVLAQSCEINNVTLCPQGLERDIYYRETDCKDKYIPSALLNAHARYNGYIDSLWSVFKTDYKSYCLTGTKDTVVVGKQSQVYHYTLYYYDLAGNLVKTAPPAGVNPIDVNANRTGLDSNRAYYDTLTGKYVALYKESEFVHAEHDLVTNYRYNSLNQLVWQKTPDGGESEFYYDILGRLVASQNAKQAAIGDVYSYTLYDDLGRIREVGEVSAAALTVSTARNYGDFKDWVAAGAQTEITRTYYDTVVSQFVNSQFVGGQQNLRNRVTTTAYFEFEGQTYTRATHYSYDIHGNVHTLIQEFPELAAVNSQFKQVEYDYDLVSGQVNNVAYQAGEADQFYHKYTYDADNRLVQAETSHDRVIWDKDANYKYYKHGPLAKTLLGEHLVQGTDYAYTLHGWLKAVNSNTLQADKDMGKDGNNSILVARDAFGFSLGYFNDLAGTTEFDGDFKAIGNDDFMATETGSPLGETAQNLYNGNIKHMVTAVKPFMQGGAGALASLYKYDQLNRIVEMQTYSSMNFATNAWNSGAPNDDFQTNYTYDANGNILSLKRKTDQSTHKMMDDLTYSYIGGTNQLSHVNDATAAGAYPNDVDDQVSNNYSYDAIGNLIEDKAESIAEIEWNVYGKIRKILRTDTSSKPNLEFQYDASGQRILKIVKPTSFEGTWKKTYYSRDAQGNVMATYESKNYIDGPTNTFTTINNYIYTSQGMTALQNVARTKFKGNSQFAGAYTARLAAVPAHYNALIGLYDIDSLMTWDPNTATIVLQNVCNTMSSSQLNMLFNTWLNMKRGNVEDAMQGTNFVPALTALLTVDNTDQILNTLGNIDNPAKIMQMYQMAGGTMPPPGMAGQIAYIRMMWSPSQIVNQIAMLYQPNTVDQMLSMLSTNLFVNGFALGNGIYDACNLFTDIANSQPASDIAVIMKDNFGYKSDKKSILVANANATYLLNLCSTHDWVNFVNSSMGANYQNMALALQDINYSISTYLGKVQQVIGQQAFGEMLNGLNLVVRNEWKAQEHFIYGSSRLGVYRSNKTLSSETFTITGVNSEGEITGKNVTSSYTYQMKEDSFARVLTEKTYELVNHLQNVLATVSDRRTPVSSGGTHIDYYEADVTTANLYYPFGMQMKTYQADSNGYRYGFGGQEMDDEIAGQGNSYTADYWQYDARLGRRFNIDPLTSDYPWQSPYACFNNNPMYFNDPLGLQGESDKPKSSSHEVSAKETLTSIAAQYDNVSPQDIINANSTLDWGSERRHGINNWVFTGETLKIPGQKAAPQKKEEAQESDEVRLGQHLSFSKKELMMVFQDIEKTVKTILPDLSGTKSNDDLTISFNIAPPVPMNPSMSVKGTAKYSLTSGKITLMVTGGAFNVGAPIGPVKLKAAGVSVGGGLVYDPKTNSINAFDQMSASLLGWKASRTHNQTTGATTTDVAIEISISVKVSTGMKVSLTYTYRGGAGVPLHQGTGAAAGFSMSNMQNRRAAAIHYAARKAPKQVNKIIKTTVQTPNH